MTYKIEGFLKMSIQETLNIPNENVVPVGKFKIELFDEKSGNKEFEMIKKNYVKQSRLDVLTKLFAYTLLPNNLSKPSLNNGLFNGILLTDYSGPTKPDSEKVINGNFIGRGLLNNTTGDAMTGVYNSIESYTTAARNKLVWDFATSSGNGTFNSVYTSNLYNSNNLPRFIVNSSLIRLVTHFVFSRIKNLNGRLAFLDKDNKKIYFKNEIETDKYVTDTYITKSDGSDYETFDTANTNFPSLVISDFTQKNGDLYILGIDRKVYKAALTNLNVLTSVSQLSSNDVLPDYNGSGFCYLPNQDKFYANGPSSTIAVYDSNFSLLSKLNPPYSNLSYLRIGTMNAVPGQDNTIHCGNMIIDVTNPGMTYNMAFTGTNNSWVFGPLNEEYSICYSSNDSYEFFW